MASAAEEVDSKFQAVFGTAQDLNDALREWGDLAGVTETDAKNLAATFGNLAMAQGLSEDVTEELVKDVAALAGDMASFNDADPSQVFNDLNKALLTAERESLKKYGIAIAESEVRTRALAIATKDGRSEVTKADRALASYEIAVEQAGKAVGDLERTSDSTANRQRQLTAEFQEQQEEIGRQLLPVYDDLLGITGDLLPLTELLTDDIGSLTSAIGTLTGALSSATGDNKSGMAGFVGFMYEAIKLTNPLNLGLDLFNATVEKFNDNAQATRDIYGQMAANATGLAGAQRDANDAMNEGASDVKTLADALQGDLFKAYRDARKEAEHLLEVQGLLAGGRDNPDYDRGEDYTTSSSIYNVNNGIS